jgi:hypothetical protein
VTGVSRRDNFGAEIIGAGERRRDEGWAIQEIANHRPARDERVASGAVWTSAAAAERDAAQLYQCSGDQ